MVGLGVACLLMEGELTAQPSPSPPDTIGVVLKAQILYDDGLIEEAEYAALKALSQPERLEIWEKGELYRLLAFCAIARDDTALAAKNFLQALHHNPNLIPDPITWSPKVRAAFERAKSMYHEEERQRLNVLLSREAIICRDASWRSLIIPGWGQKYRGESSRATIYASWAIISLSSLLYAQAQLPSAHSRYRDERDPNLIERRWETYRNLYRLRTLSLNSLILTYVVSFLDALYRPLPPQRLKEEGLTGL